MIFRRDRRTFVVSGFQRSGTTMMARALEAGGMKVARAPKGHVLHDYYELPRPGMDDIWGWDVGAGRMTLQNWLAPYRGKVVKFLTGNVSYIPGGQNEIVCVFMRRPAAECSASSAAEFGTRFALAAIDRAVEQELSRWKARTDTTFVELWYADVLADPVGQMTLLREAGFPVDPRKAARVVDPQAPLRELQAVTA